jgi:hypothetical protein
MQQSVAGQRLYIEGKDVQCPPAPLFFIKSFGHVIDIHRERVSAHESFDRCIGSERELWELDRRHNWKMLRRMSNGIEQGITT